MGIRSSIGGTRRRRARSFGALAALAALALVAAACDMDVGTGTGQLSPDVGAGTGAVVFAGRARSHEVAVAAVRQPDGKVLAVAEHQGPLQVVLVRYLPDGTLDPTFGDDGVVPTAITTGTIRRVILAPGGDLVVVGGDLQWMVARFEPDGSPKAGFGDAGSGIASSVLGLNTGTVDGVAASGNDLYIHTRYSPPTGDALVLKLGPDGTPDPAFGRVAVGDPEPGDIGLLPDGSLATTFRIGNDIGLKVLSPAGAVTTTLHFPVTPARAARVDELAAAADGSVVVGGADDLTFPFQAVLVRMTPQRTLDPAFGTGGQALVPLRVDFRPLFVERTGSTILLATDGFLKTARVTATGALDPTYGTGGIANHEQGPLIAGLVATPTGALLVASTSGQPPFRADILLLALTATGAPDTSFGDGGRSATDIGEEGVDRFTAVARLPNGHLLVAGDTGDGIMAGRYDLAGNPDHPPEAVLPERIHEPHAVRDAAVAPDGSAYLLVQVGADDLGPNFGTNRRWLIVKLDPTGDVDPSFGDAGVVTHAEGFPAAIGRQPDGTVLVAWTRWHGATGGNPATFDMMVDAFTPAGLPDTSWGTGGSLATALVGSTAPTGPPMTGWMAIGPDGTAYVSGLGLVRVAPDGSSSVAAGPLPTGPFRAYDVAVDAQGRVLVAGTTTPGAAAPVTNAVARFGPNLTLDASYGTGGVAPLPAVRAGTLRTGPLLLLAAGGSATVVESSQAAGNDFEDLVVRRLDAAGHPDTTFAGDGMAIGGLHPTGPDMTGLAVALVGADVAVVGRVAPAAGSTTGQDAALVVVNG
jgi:uncharacterized delta-60 repeat protein